MALASAHYVNPHSLSHLARSFAEHVLAQNAAIERGDAAAGNRHARKYIAAWEALRAFGAQGRDALLPLLDDPRPSIAVMAAAFLLRHAPDRSLAVLRAWAGTPGFPGFEAQETLSRWEDGSWQLDPPNSSGAT